MTLIKWINRPSVFDDVNSWLDNFSIDTPINFYNKSNSWIPQFEVQETSDSFQIFAELPGMNKKNIDIDIIDNVLTISGDKSKKDLDSNEYHYSEMSYGKFSRVFNLPEDVIDDKISAKMKDGILAIYIPRLEPVKKETKKINIK